MTHNFEMYMRHKHPLVQMALMKSGGAIKNNKSLINGIDVIQKDIKVDRKYYNGPIESINGNQSTNIIQTQQDLRNEQLGLLNPFAKSNSRKKKGAGVRLNI